MNLSPLAHNDIELPTYTLPGAWLAKRDTLFGKKTTGGDHLFTGVPQICTTRTFGFVFQGIAKAQSININLLIQETINKINNPPDRLQGSKWSNAFMFTYNYRYHADQAGLVSVQSQITRRYVPYEWLPKICPEQLIGSISTAIARLGFYQHDIWKFA